MLVHSEDICHILRQHNHLSNLEIADIVDVTELITVESTNRGGQCLFLNEFKFVHCGENKGTTHYRCSNYTRKCRARIYVKDDKAHLTGNHNHNS